MKKLLIFALLLLISCGSVLNETKGKAMTDRKKSKIFSRQLKNARKYDSHLEKMYKKTDCKFSAYNKYRISQTGQILQLALGLNNDGTFIMLAGGLPYSGTWKKRDGGTFIMPARGLPYSSTWKKRDEQYITLQFIDSKDFMRFMSSFCALFRGNHQVKILNEDQLEFVNVYESERYILTREK